MHLLKPTVRVGMNAMSLFIGRMRKQLSYSQPGRFHSTSMIQPGCPEEEKERRSLEACMFSQNIWWFPLTSFDF